MSETEEPTNHDVRVIISSLGSERRTIKFDGMSEEKVQNLIQTVSNAFGTVRVSSSLLLTGSDGVIVFANLDNIAFVEVHIV